MNLDQMLQICATFTDTKDELVKTDGAYLGEALELANKFLNAINYAKNKIVREKFRPTFSENVILDVNKSFSISELSKPLLKVAKIEYEDIPGYWQKASSWQIKCPYREEGDSIAIEYEYMPEDLTITDLTQSFDLPPGIIDMNIPCFYAAYQYFVIEGNNRDLTKAGYYLSLWNDGLENINPNIGQYDIIQIQYGM